jgi:hypothetical protein
VWEAPRQHSLYLPYQALEGDIGPGRAKPSRNKEE